MDRQTTTEKEAHTPNSGLAKVAVQYSADTFVVNQSLVLRINICGENRNLRQARKRYALFYMTSTEIWRQSKIKPLNLRQNE